VFLKHGRDETVGRGNQRCSRNAADCPKDEEGIFIGQERDDEVEDAEAEESVAEYGFRGVKIGKSAPE